MTKEGERRGLAELMANLEEWHPARRDYEAMKGLLEERFPAPSPEAVDAFCASIESAPDRERIEFIRRVAVEIMIRHAKWNSPEFAWEVARKLWEAKPDEC